MASFVLDEGIVITYHYVLPVLIGVGVIGGLGSIIVLLQPALKKTKVNRYFLALTVCDLALCIFYIPIVTSANGCEFPDYGSALYFAHLGWAIPCTFHALGTYVILFLALDRFVAVWFPTWFKSLQRSPFSMRNRLVVAAVLCTGLHLPYMVDAEVSVCDQEKCRNGSWISNDGFQKSFDMKWHKIFRHIYMPLVRWLPSILLAVFNVGLVMAVFLRRKSFPSATVAEKKKKRRNSERVLVFTVMTMTASYIILTMPITIFLTGFAQHDEYRCVHTSPNEALRHVGNCLQLLEHVVHVAFLVMINPRFRRELLRLLRCQERLQDGKDTTTPDPDSSSRPLSGNTRFHFDLSRTPSRLNSSPQCSPMTKR